MGEIIPLSRARARDNAEVDAWHESTTDTLNT
jgi:hypothetical protein